MNITNRYVSTWQRYAKHLSAPPARDVQPSVGLIPTRLLLLQGQVMLPSVSVPRVTGANPMEAAMAEPEDEPHGFARGKYAPLAKDKCEHKMMAPPA
jgi:hypothetical protein